MPFSVEELTVEDFARSGWRDAIESARERTCHHYWTEFDRKATEAEEAGDANLVNLFSLLGALSSMWIDADDPADPLKPIWQQAEHRTAIPGDFDSALDYLSVIHPLIDDAELKARVADVLWLRKRDFQAAREAVAAYLSAAHATRAEKWSEAANLIERALDIAVRTNQQDLRDEITRYIEETLAAFDGTEDSFLPAHLMKLLLERKTGAPAHYAPVAASFALTAEGRGDWHTAREYWDIQADWHRLAGDDEQRRAARLRSAETFVREAESRIASGESQGHMIAAHFLEQAIHALRAIGGQQERITELHCRLLEHQRKAAGEMKAISHEVDGSEMIAAATEAVAGKSLYDAIFALALLLHPPRVGTLRKQAEWQCKNSILSLIPITYKNAMGRTVARRDPPDLNETEDEADLRIEMYKAASLGHSLQVQGMIGPALTQILREHTVRVTDLMAIVRDNPFVPPGREDFFARGLQAGFRSDFAAAIHLLVPQIENSIRYLLEQRGVITSGLDDNGIQDERDLNSTLRLPVYAEPLKEVLGEDMLFDLRGLLIQRCGSNLRNDMAHGLLDYAAFFSTPCVYLWWLTLRLCCIPVITALKKQAEDAGKPADAQESTGRTETGGEASISEATEVAG